jgi:hypothetical protein
MKKVIKNLFVKVIVVIVAFAVAYIVKKAIDARTKFSNDDSIGI